MQAAGVRSARTTIWPTRAGYAIRRCRSSMLQDVRNGRRTEIDAINGAVTRLGTELGVSTPLNRLLTVLVHNRERAAQREQPQSPEEGTPDG